MSLSSFSFLSWALLYWLILLPFAVWVGILLLQAIGATLPIRGLLLSTQRPRIAVIVPAHNESAGILHTLNSLSPQLQAGDRLVVVADNCNDDTATVAAAAGAEVVERHDESNRGKGYALDRGVRHLLANAPDVAIIVDADCIVEAEAIDRLARACIANARPIQALYLMQSPPSKDEHVNSSKLSRLREFAWLVRNLVRPLGYLRFGQPCQLMGTGMAFPWQLIATAPLASGHLVEDMQLGVDLARAGAAPLFCPEALVTSEFPAAEAGAEQQRTRWEHGHLGMIVGTVPKLLWEALKLRDVGLLALALDMSVPPLALLVLMLFALIIGAMFIASPLLLPAALFLFALLGLSILLAWWAHGRHVLPLRTLLLVPFYVLAKLPLYIGFLRRRQVEWVRSSRSSG